MEFKSRIYASSKGTTIDAIGQGQYLVCKPSGCTKVKGLHNAHAALKQHDSDPNRVGSNAPGCNKSVTSLS